MRYLLASTALIGVCLFIYQMPVGGDRYWPMKMAAFVLGTSAVVHLATTLFRLKSWWKWLFATVVPTAGIVAWYIYGVKIGNQHPGSIGVYGFLTGGLFGFPIGFAVVNALLVAINRIGDNEPSADSS